jgi:Tir chaperone protein (CesT) family
MKRQLTLTASVLLFVCSSATIAAQTQEKVSIETVARVVRLLEGSGYRYTKLTQSAWFISFKGNAKDSVEVIVTPDREDLVFLSVIADRQQLDNNAAALRELLKANASLPERVSVMLDQDDYTVETRSPLEQLNAATFKSALLTVANAADDIFGSAVKSPPLARPAASLVGASVDGTFNAPKGATQEIDILNGKAGMSINPNLWKETRSTETGRRSFQHLRGDGYAVIIAERIEIPLDRMKEIALSNAREADPEVRITEEQHRRVNGTEVLLLRLEGKVNGIAFTYFGYYYGGPAGTVQVITYTGQNLFQEYRRDFEDFLNGFHLK